MQFAKSHSASLVKIDLGGVTAGLCTKKFSEIIDLREFFVEWAVKTDI